MPEAAHLKRRVRYHRLRISPSTAHSLLQPIAIIIWILHIYQGIRRITNSVPVLCDEMRNNCILSKCIFWNLLDQVSANCIQVSRADEETAIPIPTCALQMSASIC